MVRVRVVMGLREELTLTTTTASSNCLIIGEAVGIVAWGLERGQFCERGGQRVTYCVREGSRLRAQTGIAQ
jgi:hypothetical protein